MLVECYLWTLGVYFEPQFNVGRKILTKIIAITSILDDTYDAYGTFEELQVLTPTIRRWDRSLVNVLPEYMKPFYIAMLDLYKKISKEVDKDESSLHIHVAKEEMKKLAESYFEEAKWLNKNYKPTFKEYMELSLKTTAYSLLTSISLLGMGDMVTNEFEQEREHITSAVECYMEQYGCSEEEACVELHKQMVDAWKDVNEACLHPIAVPMPILMRAINFSRFMNVVYSDEDGYTHSKGKTKFIIESLLMNPVSG